MVRTISLVVALLAPVAADAQRQPSPRHELPPLTARLKGYRDPVRLDTGVVWSYVRGSTGQTIRHALRLLDSLKVPVALVDTVNGVIHHNGFFARNRMAGIPLSRSFRCGQGRAGDYADLWRLATAYAIYVKPDGEHSTIGIALAAGASDVEGASKPAVQCAVTGGFVKHFVKLLELKALE